MFNEEVSENIQFLLIVLPDLQLIGTRRPQIVITIHIVLVLGLNLAFILPFPVTFFYLQVKNNTSIKKKNEKYYIFCHFIP